MGVYYTPQQLTDAIVKSLKNISFRTVLEPSCGDGAFLRAIAAADWITAFHCWMRWRSTRQFRKTGSSPLKGLLPDQHREFYKIHAGRLPSLGGG